jgi:transglutaminase-like putative cysteine protease
MYQKPCFIRLNEACLSARRLLCLAVLIFAVVFCGLAQADSALAADYVQRESGQIYTVINTVQVTNKSGRPIYNITLDVPIASAEDVHWQEVLGEEFSPKPQYIKTESDGSRTAHYSIAELKVGETVDLIQRVAVQNYCVSYDISGMDSSLSLVGMEEYLQPSSEINSDAEEILEFAVAAASSSSNPYLQARLLFAAVNAHLTYNNDERSSHSALEAYRTGEGNCVDYANLYAASLRAVGIPARVCGGYLYSKEAQTSSAYVSQSGHINANLLRHNWVEFYIKGVGWLVADPTFSYTASTNGSSDGSSGGQLVDWSRFANISSANRLIYTCEYLPDKNSISYSYQGAAPLVSYNSELALYSVILPFSDLVNHWAADSVMALYYNNPPLVKGVSEKNFGVNDNMTRAELATLLNRVLDNVEPLTEAVSYSAAFKDLSRSHWAYEEIYKATARGILSGYPDGTVRPNALVTRAEAAVMLSRVIGVSYAASHGSAAESDLPYTDVSPSTYAWAIGGISNLYRQGIMRGVAAETFAPEKAITRGEGATLVYRWLQSDSYYEKYLDY